MRFFFYGTLCDCDVRRAVIGRAVPRCRVTPGQLHGFVVRRARAGAYPILMRLAGRRTPGEIVDGITENEARRLDHYEGSGYRRQMRYIATPDGSLVPAYVYLPRASERPAPGPWTLAAWRAGHKHAYFRRHGWRLSPAPHDRAGMN